VRAAPGPREELVRHLGALRWACELVDERWRLCWVSDELKAVLREGDERRLGYGRPMALTRQSSPWRDVVTPESTLRWARENVPRMVADVPELTAILRREGDPNVLSAQTLRALDPAPPPPAWSGTIEFVGGDGPPVQVSYLAARIHADGALLGTLFVYGPSLPAEVLAVVARGEPQTLEHLVRLTEPAPREAAVLFADLQRSTELSRRLPSGAYFRLIQGVLTAVDDAVIRHKGLVGKHAGDGVTAFFLAEDHGSPAGAASAALDTARAIRAATAAAVERFVAAYGAVGVAEEARVNMGVHWAGTLFMGQVITGGRLEVTALGDGVNACARIQECARDGDVLVSKDLVERLRRDDSSRHGVHADRLRYTPLKELPTASEKAIRDAGAMSVTRLPGAPARSRAAAS